MRTRTSEEIEAEVEANPATSSEAGCNCATCRKARELAKEPSDEAETLSDEAVQKELVRFDIQEKMEGAPSDLQDAVRSFVRRNNDQDWIRIVHHFLNIMSKDSSKTYAPMESDDDKVWTGFAHRARRHDQQTYQDVEVPSDVDKDWVDIPDSVEWDSVRLIVSPTHEGKDQLRDHVVTEKERIRIFFDLPLSIIWGALTYEQAVTLVKNIDLLYEHEFSQERIFVRQLEPMSELLKKRLDTELKESEQNVEELHSSIRKAARAIHDKLLHRKALESGTSLKEVAHGLIALKDRKFFSSIEMSGDKVVGILENVKVEWEDYVYEFGNFSIELQISDGTVLANQTRAPNMDESQEACVPNEYSHPHVRDNGGCCLGNYQTLITQAVLEQKFHTALSFLYEFMTSYNVGNPYVDIECWLPKEEKAARINRDLPEPQRYRLGRSEAGDGTYDYHSCNQASVELQRAGSGSRLRCLDAPFREECGDCFFRDQRMDHLYDQCKETSITSDCMKCGDSSCPHLVNSTTQCLEDQTRAAKVLANPIACLSCPYGREDSCEFAETDVAYDNCWDVQKEKTAEDRACGSCTLMECPNRPKEE